MTQNEIADALYKIDFAADLSKRYHAHRMEFHRFCAFVFQSIELIATTGVALKLLDGWPTVKNALLVIAALSAGLAILQLLKNCAEFHATKKAQFGELKKLLPVDLSKGTEANLRAARAMREDIERYDSKGFPCLDVLCHNEECRARGMDEYKKPLTWWQSHVGILVPLPYS